MHPTHCEICGCAIGSEVEYDEVHSRGLCAAPLDYAPKARPIPFSVGGGLFGTGVGPDVGPDLVPQAVDDIVARGKSEAEDLYEAAKDVLATFKGGYKAVEQVYQEIGRGFGWGYAQFRSGLNWAADQVLVIYTKVLPESVREKLDRFAQTKLGKVLKTAFTVMTPVALSYWALQNPVQALNYGAAIASFVPGVGTGVAAGLSAGAAMASGKPLSDAVIAGVRGSIPGGVAGQLAFDAAMEVSKGKNIKDVGIGLARSRIPEGPARVAFDTGIAVAHGRRLQDAAFEAARALMPGGPEGEAALEFARQVAEGKNVAEAAVSVATDVAMREAGEHGPNLEPVKKIRQAVDSALGPVDQAKKLALQTAELTKAARDLPIADPLSKLLSGGKSLEFSDLPADSLPNFASALSTVTRKATMTMPVDPSVFSPLSFSPATARLPEVFNRYPYLKAALELALDLKPLAYAPAAAASSPLADAAPVISNIKALIANTPPVPVKKTPVLKVPGAVNEVLAAFKPVTLRISGIDDIQIPLPKDATFVHPPGRTHLVMTGAEQREFLEKLK